MVRTTGRPRVVLLVGVALLLSACASSNPTPSTGPSTTPPEPGTVTPTEPPSPTPSEPVVVNPAPVVKGQPYEPMVPPPAEFVALIDNPYLPFIPGTRFVYEGVSDGQHERNVVEVTDRTKVILGVTTTVVHDQVFANGGLAEDTFDWYAQDSAGNVWYFGEDTGEYDHGTVVSTKGSWEAGVDGALPGIVMLGAPQIGEAYHQEYLAGEAEDRAKVVALGRTVEVPYGAIDRVVVTEEGTPLEPNLLEHKFYAPGIGVVLERVIRGGQEVSRLVAYTSGA